MGATTANAHTQRWTSRCASVGLGYVVDATARLLTHEAPCPKSAQQLSDASDGLDHGEAIDTYLRSTLPLFESTFSPAPRCRCPGCGQTRRWLCCRCISWMPPIESEPPARLELPFRLVVLVRDQRDAATGIHAAMLASPVTVRHFHAEVLQQDWREDFDPATSFVLYPSDDALTARELVQRMPLPQSTGATSMASGTAASAAGDAAAAPPRPRPPTMTIIVPDTKWNNDGAVLAHPSLRALARVKLRWPPSHSRIWRCSARAVSGCVSTVEAIYCLLREVEHEQQLVQRRQQQVAAVAAAAAAGRSEHEPRQAAAVVAEAAHESWQAAEAGSDGAADTSAAEATTDAAADAAAAAAASGDPSSGAAERGSAPPAAEQLLLLFAMTRHLIARQVEAAGDAGGAAGGGGAPARPAPFEEESKAASRLRRGQKAEH